MTQLDNIEAIEKRLWAGADNVVTLKDICKRQDVNTFRV
jgi:hypothetical protein